MYLRVFYSLCSAFKGVPVTETSASQVLSQVTKASKAVYDRLESVTGKNASTSALNQVARTRGTVVGRKEGHGSSVNRPKTFQTAAAAHGAPGQRAHPSVFTRKDFLEFY